MDYKQLTVKEITILTLERMREEKITAMVTNDVLLEAVKKEKKKGGSSEARTNLAQQIMQREAASVQAIEDLKLIERRLGKAKSEK